MDKNAFAERLLAGEKIVWAGRPHSGIIFTSQDLVLIPFSLLWCGLAISFEIKVLRDGAPIFKTLVGRAFVGIGLFMVVGRFVLDAWLRTRTAYAVTDSRVLILRAGPWGMFQALSLDRLQDTTLVDRPGERGTIRFGQPVSGWNSRSSPMTPALDPTPQFLAIPDAKRVFALVQERTRREARFS